MMRAFVLGLVALGGACSSSVDDPAATGFPKAPLASVVTDTGALAIEVRSSPSQPPGRGLASFEYVVRDRSGGYVDGLTIDAVPWMPAHGHGASVHPTTTARGSGHYVVDGVSLFMPGHWEIRTSIAGAETHNAVVAFDVP